MRGSPHNDWPGVFNEVADAIAKHIGRQRDLVVAAFSTTGPIEKAASEIVLMSAMRHYFDITVMTLCGIPCVTLLGTPEDWLAIKRRAEVLTEYGLDGWMRELSPILAQLCEAAAGRPDREMWRSFYKYESRSGGDSVTGSRRMDEDQRSSSARSDATMRRASSMLEPRTEPSLGLPERCWISSAYAAWIPTKVSFRACSAADSFGR